MYANKQILCNYNVDCNPQDFLFVGTDYVALTMKLLLMFEKLLNTTVVSGEIELDEKYLLNSHKGEKIAGVEPRKRGGSASKRGLSNEQICLPTLHLQPAEA